MYCVITVCGHAVCINPHLVPPAAGSMPLNNVAVSSSSSDDSFQQQDKLTMTSLHHGTVLYNMSNAIKKEPLESGVYSSYHQALHLDYATASEEPPSSRGPAPGDEVSVVSTSSSEPGVYTTLTASTPLMAQTDVAVSHHLHPTEYLGGHDMRGPPPAHLMGPGMNSEYMKVSGDGSAGGVTDMVRAMCGDMDGVEEKELAKLQTVQMDEDMADL